MHSWYSQWQAGTFDHIFNSGWSLNPFTILLLHHLSSTTAKSWPVGLVVMMVVGIGYLVGRNQSRPLYTVITFPNPHAKFPFCLLLLHFSTPLLPLSSSSAFISLYFPWYLIQQRHSGYSFYSAVYIPFSAVPCPTLQPLISPPCPLLLLHDYSPELILQWHTLSSQMKETLSDCLVCQRGTIPHKGTLCVFFPTTLAWKIRDEENELDRFFPNTWNRRIWEFPI